MLSVYFSRRADNSVKIDMRPCSSLRLAYPDTVSKRNRMHFEEVVERLIARSGSSCKQVKSESYLCLIFKNERHNDVFRNTLLSMRDDEASVMIGDFPGYGHRKFSLCFTPKN